MEILNLFPTEIFIFKNLNINNSELILNLEQLDDIQIKHSTTISLLVDLRKHSKFNSLFQWFDECLENVRQHMKYDCDKIEITNSWCNVALPTYEMFQNYHKHSMSFYSAVYYLTTGAPTEFEDPVNERKYGQLEVLRHNYRPYEISLAEPGKLVIFPSWLFHSSLVHRDTEKRYVISFNTLPTGKINHNLATDSKAEIYIK